MAANSAIASGFLAAVQARVIYGFSLDRPAASADRPLIILDLHPGSGRFGYQLVHRLASRCEQFGAPSEPPFVYVMAGDEPAVARWQANPWLERAGARGLLDVARIDDDPLTWARGQPIVLERAGLEISADARAASLVIVANQVFSRGAHDLFHVERGQLYRCTRSADTGADAYQLHPLADTAAYEHPVWNQILASYAERLDQAAFSLSPSALGWIEHLRRVSDHGMLLCADRGYVHEESLDGRPLPPVPRTSEDPGASPRTSDVNFNALAELAVRTGGTVLIPSQPAVHCTMIAFLSGAHPAPPRETVRAYRDAATELSAPDDWLALEPLIEQLLPRASAEQLCAYVRMSGWDDRVLARCLPHLLARVQAGQVPPEIRTGICHLVEEVWSHHLPEPGPDRDAPDIAFAMGVLLFGLAYYEQAVRFFERSLDTRGPSAAAYYNLAMGAVQLGRRERALEHLEAALALEPDFAGARDLRLRITGGM